MANRYLVGAGARNWSDGSIWSSTSGGSGADLLGSELITAAADRDFSSNTGWWTLTGGALITGGIATIISATGAFSGIQRMSGLTIGKCYALVYEVIANRAGSLYTDVSVALDSTVGVHTKYFVSTDGSITIKRAPVGSGITDIDIDNVSIKEVLTYPTSSDDVIFDSNSGSGILTLDTNAVCGSLNSSALAGIITITGSVYTLSNYGNLTEHASNSQYNLTGTSYFYQKGTGTITTNGNTYHTWNRWYIDGADITVTHADHIVLPYVWVYITNGTWELNNKNFTTTRRVQVTAGTKILNLGSSTLTVPSWWVDTGTGTTINAGTSVIYCSDDFSDASTSTYYTIDLTSKLPSTTPLSVNGCVNLYKRPVGGIAGTINLSRNIVISGILHVAGYDGGLGRVLIQSSTFYTPRTITIPAENVILNNADLLDITFANPVDVSSFIVGDCGGNNGITFTSSQTQYYKGIVSTELITNIADRQFSIDTGTWIKTGVATIEGGQGKLSYMGGQATLAYAGIISSGKTYSATYTITLDTAPSVAVYHAATSSSDTTRVIYYTQSGTYNFTFTYGNANSIAFSVNSSGIAYIDNISVREIGTCAITDQENWFQQTNGTGGQGRCPLPQDDLIFDSNSFSSSTLLLLNVPRLGKNLDMSTLNQAIEVKPVNYHFSVFGSFILNPIITYSFNSRGITFLGRSNYIFNGAGKHFMTLAFNCGTYTFVEDCSFVYLNNTPQSTLYFGDCVLTNYADNSGGFGINYQSTVFPENSTIIISPTYGALAMFKGGNKSWNVVKLTGLATTPIEVQYQNTINELIIDAGKTVTFSPTWVNTIAKITAKGSNTNKITIKSASTTPATVVYSGTVQPDIKFVDFSYMTFTNPINARASINSGNNSGITFNPAKFWIGGTGNINDLAHWSDSSGGSATAVLPSATDDIFFDENSHPADSQVLSLSADLNCLSLDFEALTKTMTLSGSVYVANVYGGLFLSTKLTASLTGTSYLNLKAFTSQAIWANGSTISWNRLYFNGVGGTWTNQDDCNLEATYLYHVNGTWNTNNKTLWSEIYTVWSGGPKTLILGNSTLYPTRIYNYDFSNLTLNYGTSKIVTRHGSNKFGPVTWYDWEHLGNSCSLDDGYSPTFHSMSFEVDNGSNRYLQLYANITVNESINFKGSNASNYRLFVFSNTIGTPRIITVPAANVTASNVDFRDITFTNPVDLSVIPGGSGDCGGNSGITFSAPITTYFKHTSGDVNWSDSTKWVSSSGGSSPTRVPIPQDTVIIDNNSASGATRIITNVLRIGNLDMSNCPSFVTMRTLNANMIYGEYTLNSNTKWESNGYGIDFFTRVNRSYDFLNIKHNGFSFYPLNTTINISNVNLESGMGLLLPSTYNLNGNFTARVWRVLYAATTSNIYLNNSILRSSGTSPIYISSSASLYAQNSTIIIEPINLDSPQIYLGGKSYNIFKLSGSSTGNYDFSAHSNSFNELVIESNKKVRFTAGTTQNIAQLSMGAGASIDSITAAEHTLNYTGTSYVQTDGVTIKNSKVLPVNRWYAGENSTNSGGNTNWLFKRYILTPITTLLRKIS